MIPLAPVTTRRPVRSGRDSHRLDPLANLELNIDAQRARPCRDPRPRPRPSRRTERSRRRGLRAGRRRATDLDPPDRRGRRTADRPGHADPSPVARVPRTANQPGHARADERISLGPAARLFTARAGRSRPGTPSAGRPRRSPNPSAAGRIRCRCARRALSCRRLARHRPIP
jgi:hypothetical protein